MNIRAITFDVGGTLIEPWPSVGHVYAEVAARHGVRNASADLLEARFRAAWRARPGFENSRAGWAEVVDEAFAGLVDRPPRETFFDELYERFAEAAAWRVYDDVMPALDALAARGLPLGVVSNWDERLPVLLRRLGLFPRFKAVIVSFEAGVSKPSPAIFNQAAMRLGLPPAQMLHVGDSHELDVLGARAAGFNALRVRRGANGSRDDDILSLTELLHPDISHAD